MDVEEAEPKSAAVASEGTLRRLERLVAGYGVVAAGTSIALGSWPGAGALTLMTAGSILALRGVEGFVRRLLITSDGEVRGGVGRLILPWAMLVAALGAAFALGSHDSSYGTLALVVGASLLPLALITEAMIQTITTFSSTARGRSPAAAGDDRRRADGDPAVDGHDGDDRLDAIDPSD